MFGLLLLWVVLLFSLLLFVVLLSSPSCGWNCFSPSFVGWFLLIQCFLLFFLLFLFCPQFQIRTVGWCCLVSPSFGWRCVLSSVGWCCLVSFGCIFSPLCCWVVLLGFPPSLRGIAVCPSLCGGVPTQKKSIFVASKRNYGSLSRPRIMKKQWIWRKGAWGWVPGWLGGWWCGVVWCGVEVGRRGRR